jgi:PAS domain-containing protein
VGLLIDVLSGQLALTGVDLSHADSLAADPCCELVDNISDVVYVHDLKGNFLSANKAIQPLTGFSREEVLRMRLADLLAPESADLALRMTANNLAPPVPVRPPVRRPRRRPPDRPSAALGGRPPPLEVGGGQCQ